MVDGGAHLSQRHRMPVRSLVWVFLSLASCAHSAGEHHSFDDADAWAKAFEDPSRDEWQQPGAVVSALELNGSMAVADIGAATGYFPVRFAKVARVVYGIDIESSMVTYLNQRAEREGLSNLSAVLALPDDPKIPAPVDLITVVDTYHHLEHRPEYFARLKSSLKPKGRVAIIDFKMGSKRGPHDAAKVPVDVVRREFEEAGYRLLVEHSFLADQYFVVFTPNDT